MQPRRGGECDAWADELGDAEALTCYSDRTQALTVEVNAPADAQGDQVMLVLRACLHLHRGSSFLVQLSQPSTRCYDRSSATVDGVNLNSEERMDVNVAFGERVTPDLAAALSAARP